MFNPYVIGAVALIFIGLGSWGALEMRHAGSLERELGAARLQHTIDARVIKSDTEALTQALAAVRQWKATCTDSIDKAAAAERQALALKQRLDQQHQQFTQAMEKDHALPQCQKLLSMDLAALCPDVARRLRGVPASQHRDEDRHDRGAGGEEVAARGPR